MGLGEATHGMAWIGTGKAYVGWTWNTEFDFSTVAKLGISLALDTARTVFTSPNG